MGEQQTAAAAWLVLGSRASVRLLPLAHVYVATVTMGLTAETRVTIPLILTSAPMSSAYTSRRDRAGILLRGTIWIS